MIVQFFSEHATERRREWRRIYEEKRRQEGRSTHAESKQELVEEMGFLKRLAEQEDRMSRTYDLTLSLLGFVTFWMAGAAAYHAIEGWSFGESVYYCYITFFTIGFVGFPDSFETARVSISAEPVIQGDFSPSTAAGE